MPGQEEWVAARARQQGLTKHPEEEKTDKHSEPEEVLNRSADFQQIAQREKAMPLLLPVFAGLTIRARSPDASERQPRFAGGGEGP